MRSPQLLASHLSEVSPTLHERWHRYVPVAPEWACWEWQGCLGDSGYGRITVGPHEARGKNHVLGYAHRASYWLFVGEIAADQQIDHMCWNRSCVNPYHLRCATPLENTHNSEVSNAVKSHCPAGHPYDGDNLYAWTDTKTGYTRRYCRTCKDAA